MTFIQVPVNHTTVNVANLRSVMAASTLLAIGALIGSIFPLIVKAVPGRAVLAVKEFQTLFVMVIEKANKKTVPLPPAAFGRLR